MANLQHMKKVDGTIAATKGPILSGTIVESLWSDRM